MNINGSPIHIQLLCAKMGFSSSFSFDNMQRAWTQMALFNLAIERHVWTDTVKSYQMPCRGEQATRSLRANPQEKRCSSISLEGSLGHGHRDTIICSLSVITFGKLGQLSTMKVKVQN